MTQPILTTEIDTRKLELTMRLFPRQLKMNLGDALDHIRRHFLKQWRQERLQGPPGVRGRSHGIFSRFRAQFLVPHGGIENMGLHIFTTSKIAKQQETGGRVYPSGGGKLAVPLSERTELFTSTGLLRRRYRKPGDLKNVVPIRFKGKTFLTKVKKRSRELTPLFVLKPSVKLQARLGFMATWDKQENWRLNRINKAVNKTLAEV